MKKSCLVLAAGDGTRMKSKKPKVLCTVLGKPMLGWVLDNVRKLELNETGIIIGNNADSVKEYAISQGEYKFYIQSERKGTAHAVMQGEELFSDEYEHTLVLCGDAPFVSEDVLKSSFVFHTENNNDITVISSILDNPFGYGRIIRKGDSLDSIVEEKDCTENQKEVKEINSGVYWFKSSTLKRMLPKISNNNIKGEYYLTDIIRLSLGENGKVNAFLCESSDIVLGANTRADLSRLNRIARDKILDIHMEKGVDFPLTDGIIIEKDVIIGADTVIFPNTILRGKTIVGEGCTIGPNSLIENCKIGDNVKLNNVQAYDSIVEDNVKAGPFVHIRPNSTLKNGVKIGDFVEVKNAEIGDNTAIAHLSYVGDSIVGKCVNFGCGTVTANYDGINKHQTIIGDNAFIGCNTNLVAPVKIGDNATTAAGSTITKDVPPNSLAVERASTRIKENWKHNKLRLENKKSK